MSRRGRVLAMAVLLPLLHLAAIGPSQAAVASAPRPADCPSPQTLGLEPGAKHAVILVHGWNGDTHAMDAIAKAIENRFRKTSQIYAFDYHTHNDNWAGDKVVGDCLAVFVNTVAAASRKGRGDGKVFLIGHSMGGLAIRYASQLTIGGRVVGEDIAGVVTLDTPHLGSYWGGTHYARWMSEILGGFSREWAPLPSDKSDAARCLARHQGGDTFPRECGSPPDDLPASAKLLEVSGQVSIRRTFLGIPLYTYALDGDSVVDTLSQRGYIEAGARSTKNYGPVAIQDVFCTADTGQLLYKLAPANARLAALVAEGIADIAVDNAAMADVQAGRISPAIGAILIAANVVAECSHNRITSQAKALSATVNQLATWFDEIDNPLFAYSGESGLAVARGTKVVARASGGSCGAVGSYYGRPTWSHNGRYVTSVWSDCEDDGTSPPDHNDNVVFVIDVRTGAKRQISCGCGDVAAIDSTRMAWVNDHGRPFITDLANTAKPASWSMRLPSGWWPKQTLSSIRDGVLVQATRRAPGRGGYSQDPDDDGPGAVFVVAADGRATLLREFDNLAYVGVAAATTRAASGQPQFVYTTIESMGDCAHPGPIWITDPTGARQVKTNTSALAADGAEVFMHDAWWNAAGQLHATLSSSVCDPLGGKIKVPWSLWRLDNDRWVSVDKGPLNEVRQLTPQIKIVIVNYGDLYLERKGRGTKMATFVGSIEVPHP